MTLLPITLITYYLLPQACYVLRMKDKTDELKHMSLFSSVYTRMTRNVTNLKQ